MTSLLETATFELDSYIIKISKYSCNSFGFISYLFIIIIRKQVIIN